MSKPAAYDRPPATDTASTVKIIRAAVPKDKASVTLEMLPGSGASGAVTLTPRGLLNLIQTLGRVHAALMEGKPVPPLDSQSVPAVSNPAWRVGLAGAASAFTFHHPAYGPLGFVVPMAEIETMAQALLHQIASTGGERH